MLARAEVCKTSAKPSQKFAMNNSYSPFPSRSVIAKSDMTLYPLRTSQRSYSNFEASPVGFKSQVLQFPCPATRMWARPDFSPSGQKRNQQPGALIRLKKYYHELGNPKAISYLTKSPAIRSSGIVQAQIPLSLAEYSQLLNRSYFYPSPFKSTISTDFMRPLSSSRIREPTNVPSLVETLQNASSFVTPLAVQTITSSGY